MIMTELALGVFLFSLCVSAIGFVIEILIVR